MTTEAGGYRVDVAPNLFEPNECVNLPQLLNADVALGLACISVSRRVEPLQRSDLMWSCVERARELFLSRVGLWTCWLFACVCGDDSRITRHQGLWKVLAKQGLPSPGQATAETVVSKGGAQICIYGATSFEHARIASLRSVVTPASRSFLALLPTQEPPAVDLAIAMGWDRGMSDLEELRDIALIVSKQNGVLLRLFGEFDDREAGVDCIMSNATYEKAAAVLQRGDSA